MPSTYDTPVFPGPVHAHWQATAASKGLDLIARIRDRYHLQLRCQTCSGSFTAKLFTLMRHQPLCPHCLAVPRNPPGAISPTNSCNVCRITTIRRNATRMRPMTRPACQIPRPRL